MGQGQNRIHKGDAPYALRDETEQGIHQGCPVSLRVYSRHVLQVEVQVAGSPLPYDLISNAKTDEGPGCAIGSGL